MRWRTAQKRLANGMLKCVWVAATDGAAGLLTAVLALGDGVIAGPY